MTEKQKRLVTEYLRSSDPETREKLQTVVEQCTGVEKKDVLRELREVAFAQGSDETGSRVKLASKLRALELLGKHLGMFEQGSAKPDREPVRIIDDIGGKGGPSPTEGPTPPGDAWQDT